MNIFKHRDYVIVRDGRTHEVPVSDVVEGKVAEDLVDVDEYALLSANVYHPEAAVDACCESKDRRFKVAGWSRLAWDWEIETSGKPWWCRKLKGLGYEVYVKQEPGVRPQAAIVFRGTDQLRDWWSNLRWIARIVPGFWDQYDQVAVLVPELVRRLRKKYRGDVEIVAAGHSLGGGLAQHAAYVSRSIRKVFAFNSSVVTGYFSVSEEERERNRVGVRIYRVYEHGEILAYVRFAFKRIVPLSRRDPEVVELRYNVLSGGWLFQHGIKALACRLHELASRRDSDEIESAAA